MTKFYKISLGKQGAHAAEARAGGWVGVGWFPAIDLTGRFPDEWREFNKTFIPVFLESGEGTSKVAAGLACGMTWTVCHAMQEGDYVIAPKGLAPEILDRLTKASMDIVQSPEFVKFSKEGYALDPKGPNALREEIIRDTNTFSELLKASDQK